MKIGILKEVLSLFDDNDEIFIKTINDEKKFEIVNASYSNGALELRAFEGELDLIIKELVASL